MQSFANMDKSWFGAESELLEPEDWFEKGHDLTGGYNKDGFWYTTARKGTFLWCLPPAIADVALEQLRIARIKRQQS